MADGTKEPFEFSKQGAAFADVTRWFKDTFGTLRGIIGIVLIACAVFGFVLLWNRVTDHFFPKKEPAQVGQVTNSGSGKVEVMKIEKQKNSVLGLF